MSFQPSPKQTLALWSMLFARSAEQREPAQSRTSPKLEKHERDPLIRAGWLDTERRGRATHLIPTERAWAFAAEHLDSPLPAKSQSATPVLVDVLAHVGSLLARQGLSLAQLVAPPARDDAHDEAVTEAELTDRTATDLTERVLTVARRISGGRRSRVRLSSLRSALGDISRGALDESLVRLQKSGALVLYPIDDPLDRTPDDEAASLSLGGRPRHILYVED